jgi:hypothetical protein
VNLTAIRTQLSVYTFAAALYLHGVWERVRSLPVWARRRRLKG